MKKALEAVVAGMVRRQQHDNLAFLKRPVFTPQLEEELVSYMLAMKNRMYGLTTLDARCLAYQLAERNGIAHNYPNQNKAAGKDCLRVFRLRHPQLSIRFPESTSVAREMEFNKPVVT
ncbi:hypothetical protein PR048_027997 [Dryococelus australis]|uniref:Uncharacterized protein n=1 Tax=Dryococelus australis TaxID=614101 RepID=A0ABQ9GI22_9NEOP|nr:hypothetical protein PR048_027997 [Dryococelus australis]